MVLKLLNTQLNTNPRNFLAALKESGHYESLLRFVNKEAAQEIKGSIVPIEWLEQACFNIRKRVCENQASLLKTQETQMKLVGDKIYASVLNLQNEKDKSYTRVKLQMAFNHKVFPQRKDIRLVSEAFISQDSEEQKVEQQICLVEPAEFQEGNALQVLSMSVAIITYEADLHTIVTQIR